MELLFKPQRMDLLWKALVPTILVASIFACEKDLTIEMDESDQLIIINSVFNPEDIFRIEVTKSFSPFGSSQVEELKDAKVSLLENGSFLEELTYASDAGETIGSFASTIIPSKNKIYQIEVEDPKLGKAQASSIIPDKVNVDNVLIEWTRWGKNNLTSVRYLFSFELNDQQQENYYFLTMSSPIYKLNSETDEYEFHANQYMEIKTGDLPEHQLYVRNGLLFRDENFDGNTYQIVGSATTYLQPFGDFDQAGDLMRDTSVLQIQLHSLSEELYNFYSSHSTVLLNQNDIYSEPAPIYTNVENGLGTFGGENITVIDAEISY